MDTKIVTIDLGERSYDIYIGTGLIYRLADFIPEELDGRSIFIVTDENIESYAVTIRDIIQETGAAKTEIITLSSGEKTKSFAQVEKLTHWLLENGVNRNSMIFSVGGGVIGDITGFCASIVMRGVPYIQIPTSLLSLVDSSVGGKTGINTKHGKNLIGSFYQPAAVIADIDMLKTLPKRELLSGYAEVVKYGLINDESFFVWLEENSNKVLELDEQALSYIIEVSSKAKAAIVQADEKEYGQRALLNLGHTFGHALETAAGYGGNLLHGEAVAMGIVMAFDLSVRMNLCSRDDLERVERHFENARLHVRASYIEPPLKTNIDRLMEIMSRDKKVSSGKMKFVLARSIGETFLTDDAPENLIRAVLKDSIGSEVQGIKERSKSAFS